MVTVLLGYVEWTTVTRIRYLQRRPCDEWTVPAAALVLKDRQQSQVLMVVVAVDGTLVRRSPWRRPIAADDDALRIDLPLTTRKSSHRNALLPAVLQYTFKK